MTRTSRALWPGWRAPAIVARIVREGHVREGDPVILVRPEPDPGI